MYRETIMQIGTSITQDVYAAIIDSVKSAATGFPASHLMNALGIVYPQYWLDEECEQNFNRHLRVIKDAYGYAKPITNKKSTSNLEVDPLLSLAKLDMQANLFKLTMQRNAKLMMLKPFDMNAMSRTWHTIEANSHLRHQLLEYMKIREISIVMVLGFVQDE